MPPQKNSGAKKSSRISGVSKKNSRFVQEFMEELKAEGNVESIHVARVTRTMGNGRVEVYFISKDQETSHVRGNLEQAIIRGSFRGRSKRDVWIDVGTIVAVADSGLKGSASLEIMAVFTADQVRELRKDSTVDPRTFISERVETGKIEATLPPEDGFEFDGTEEPEQPEKTGETDREINIDSI
jgi:hypothetical protein